MVKRRNDCRRSIEGSFERTREAGHYGSDASTRREPRFISDKRDVFFHAGPVLLSSMIGLRTRTGESSRLSFWELDQDDLRVLAQAVEHDLLPVRRDIEGLHSGTVLKFR